MNIYIDMLLLATIMVFVVDISGFTDTWKGWLERWLGVKVGRVRPFDCSLCSTWWACVVLLLCRHAFTLPCIAFAALLAALTRPIGAIINLARYGLELAVSWLNTQLDKLIAR